MGLWRMSIAGGLLIISIVFARALFKNRLPKIIFYLFWLVALARLLIPYQLPSQASVYNLFSQIGTGALVRAETATYPREAVDQSPAPLSLTTVQEAFTDTVPEGITDFEQVEKSIAGTRKSGGMEMGKILLYPLLYALGAAGLVLYFSVKHIACRKEYGEGLPCEVAAVRQWQERQKLRRRFTVRVSDKIKVPMTYGVFRPVILMPKTFGFEDETRLCFVLAHEMVHIRRFDVLYKLLLLAACCIHWFNPLVWLMTALAIQDIELSCDEAVVKALGSGGKKAYALALIHLEEEKAGMTPLYNAFAQNSTRERIESVMKYKKVSIAGLCAGVALIAAGVLFFATSPAAEEGEALETAGQDGIEVRALGGSLETAENEIWEYPFVSQVGNTQSYTGNAYYSTVNWRGYFDDADKEPMELLSDLPPEILAYIDVENFAYKDQKFTGFTTDDKLWALELFDNNYWIFKMQEEDYNIMMSVADGEMKPAAAVWGKLTLNPFSLRYYNYGADIAGNNLKVQTDEGLVDEHHVTISDYSEPLCMAELKLAQSDKVRFYVENESGSDIKLHLVLFEEDGSIAASTGLGGMSGEREITISAPGTGIFNLMITVEEPELLGDGKISISYELMK